MTTQEQVKQIVAESLELAPDAVDCAQDISEMPGFDSMRSVLILSKIEDTFDVLIPEDDIFDITSVDEWVAEIEKLRA